VVTDSWEKIESNLSGGLSSKGGRDSTHREECTGMPETDAKPVMEHSFLTMQQTMTDEQEDLATEW